MTSMLALHGLNAKRLQYIGAITAGAAIIDSALAVAITFFLQLDQQAGLAITVPIQLGDKINLINALGKQRLDGEQTLKNFHITMSAISSAIGKRNDIIHGYWKYYPKTKRVAVVNYRQRGELTSTELPLPLNYLRAVAAEIGTAVEKLDAFLRSLKSMPNDEIGYPPKDPKKLV